MATKRRNTTKEEPQEEAEAGKIAGGRQRETPLGKVPNGENGTDSEP